MVSNKSNKTKK